GERAYTDVDLLVQSTAVARAEQSLEEIGFIRVDRDEDWMGPAPKYAHTFYRETDGAVIDLHWRLSGVPAGPEELWRSLCGHTTELDVGGRLIKSLDSAACALLV